jgi:hypothetical protein
VLILLLYVFEFSCEVFEFSCEMFEFSCEVFELLSSILSMSIAICSGSKFPFIWEGEVRVVAPRGVGEL